MTREEKLAYQREWYKKHRKEVLAKSKKAYRKKTLKKRMAAYRRKYNADHADEIKEKSKARWDAKNTEEFRAERRRRYAEKHKDDPMTEHRKRCIEAQKKRMTLTLEDRKERKMNQQAWKVAIEDIKDIETYLEQEEEQTRSRETVIKYIYKWTKRKVFAGKILRDGDILSETDTRAYYKESLRYIELERRLNELSDNDYANRNILSYKMRCIEDRFNELLNKHQETKKQLKQ